LTHWTATTPGVNPRRAIEQIVEYKNDPGNGYTRTILCFVQLFVVTNRDSTYYFANNNARHFAFNADERFLPIYEHAAPDNSKIRGVDRFADSFLAKCTLAQMISRYMVLVASEQKLLLMRPYQIYAVKNIVECIENNLGNGYMRFKAHGVAPKSAADFAFLLHGLHYLKDDGVMAIILPHGVLFRGGVEERIRTKLLKDGHIDTVIGLPAILFYSTGIPVCILVLKKCKKPDDVLFINAAGPENFDKGKRQNQMSEKHIARIIETYQKRPKQIERYARRVEMKEIEANDFNLNISRYVSTAEEETEIDLAATHSELVEIEKAIRNATDKHNEFLKELGLSLLPSPEPHSSRE